MKWLWTVVKEFGGLFTGGGFSGLVATLILGVALGGWGGWKVQGWRHAEQARQIEEQARKAQQEARADEMVRVRNTERISDEQHRREKRTAARLADSERAAAGLRDEVQRLNRGAVPESPELAALTLEARTARDLLGRCSEAYRRVDGRAQALGDQVTGLQDFAVTSCRAGQGGPPGSE